MTKKQSSPQPIVHRDELRLRSYDIAGLRVDTRHDYEPRDGEDKDLLGTYSMDESTAAIHPTLHERVRQEVECHEVVESWDTTLGLELPHGKIQALGAALHQFLRSAIYTEDE